MSSWANITFGGLVEDGSTSPKVLTCSDVERLFGVGGGT
jgi:hypothetical protein